MIQDAPAELPEVVVTAARLPPAAGEAAFSVIRLDGDTIGREARLDEALASVPAVGLFRRNSSLTANPTTQGLSLRAVAPTGAGRALVTLDGVPLNDPFGGWVIWSQLAPEAVESADIVRGGGTGPYGAGALTGSVLLRERDSGGALDLSAGSRDSLRASGAGRFDLGPIAITASGLSETTDGHIPVAAAQRGAADQPLSLEARAASVRADTALGSARVSLRLAGYREDRGSGLLNARSRAEGHVVSLTAARDPDDGATGWRAQVWRRESDLYNLSAAVAADRSTTTPANEQYETPAVGWGVNLAARRRAEAFGGRLEGEAGFDARRFEGETHERFRFMEGAFTRDRRAGGQADVAGLYVEGSWSNPDWLLAGGLRLDRWRAFDGLRIETDRATGDVTLTAPSEDRSGEVFSARAAVRRALGEDLSIRAAVYSAFRPPTLNELHRPFRVGNDITEANALLEPERLAGAEIGLAGRAGPLEWIATAFVARVEDAIVNVTIGEGPGTFPVAGFVPAGGVLRQRRNAGTIEAMGVEASAKARFGDTLDLTAGLSLTDAEMDGGAAAPQLTGLRPAQAPQVAASLSLDWRATERLGVFASVRHEGRRFDDDLNSRVLGAATTVDVRADWRLNDAARIYLAADNLLDADVETAETATGVESFGPPRAVRIGVSLAF